MIVSIKFFLLTSICMCDRNISTYEKEMVYLRSNSTVFEELEVSIVNLTVANAVLLATRSGASKTDIFATVKSTIDTDNSSNTK